MDSADRSPSSSAEDKRWVQWLWIAVSCLGPSLFGGTTIALSIPVVFPSWRLALARAATLLVAWVALKLVRAFGDDTGFALGGDSQVANLGEHYVLDAAAG